MLYIEGLASPFTVNTMPEKTLHAFADHGKVGEPLPADGGDAEETLAAFTEAGIDTDEVAAQAADRRRRGVRQVLERAAGDDLQAARAGRLAGVRMTPTPLRAREALRALERHHAEIEGRHLRDLFADDPGRGERLTAEGAGLFLDYSKNRVDRRDAAAARRARRRVRARRAPRGDVHAASTSTSPRTGRCSTSRCGCRASAR